MYINYSVIRILRMILPLTKFLSKRMRNEIKRMRLTACPYVLGMTKKKHIFVLINFILFLSRSLIVKPGTTNENPEEVVGSPLFRTSTFNIPSTTARTIRNIYISIL